MIPWLAVGVVAYALVAGAFVGWLAAKVDAIASLRVHL